MWSRRFGSSRARSRPASESGGGVTGPRLERGPVGLAGRHGREDVEGNDLLGPLELGDAASGEPGSALVEVERCRGDDEGDDAFAEPVVGPAYSHRLAHRGMGLE